MRRPEQQPIRLSGRRVPDPPTELPSPPRPSVPPPPPPAPAHPLRDRRLTARTHALYAAIAELTLHAGGGPGAMVPVPDRPAVRAQTLFRAEQLEEWLLRPVDAPPPVTPTGGLPDVQD